jgi:hypothetical protein
MLIERLALIALAVRAAVLQFRLERRKCFLDLLVVERLHGESRPGGLHRQKGAI